jgi:hypothetical protein
MVVPRNDVKRSPSTLYKERMVIINSLKREKTKSIILK